MPDKILERIIHKANVPDLLEVLTQQLSLADLQSLLLEVYRRRAARLTPADLLQQYEQNRFVKPAGVSPQALLDFDRLAYSLLPAAFEILELSPVCPLGTNSAMATVDQNKVITTIRNTEVCADATNVLALECARRRRPQGNKSIPSNETVRLCASQRVVRAQVFQGPATFPHFRLFSLCTAGRDQGSYRFELEALTEQIEFYLRLLTQARVAGYRLQTIKTSLTAFDESRYEALRTQVLEPLAAKYGGLTFEFDQERDQGRGYYVGAGFQIHVSDLSGQSYFLVDGGFTDWTQQLLSNRKERLLISGLGSERFVFCFG